jgi:hypothetical protein
MAATNSSGLTGSARKSRAPLRTASRIASVLPAGPYHEQRRPRVRAGLGERRELREALGVEAQDEDIRHRVHTVQGVRVAIADQARRTRDLADTLEDPRRGRATPLKTGWRRGL